jgi:hypothetical protein
MKFVGKTAWWSLLGSSLLTPGNASHLRRSLQTSQVDPDFDRVDAIDQTLAECTAANDATGATELTKVNYFYAVHATSALDQRKLFALENMLFSLIQSTVLWCTMPEQSGIDLGADGGQRFRQLVQSQECKFPQHEWYLHSCYDSSLTLTIPIFSQLLAQ